MSEDRPWRIEIASRAEAELKRLPVNEQMRIRRALDRLWMGPDQGDVRKLAGRENEWRLRVGDYRILFSRDFLARVIVVLHVLPRGGAYRR